MEKVEAVVTKRLTRADFRNHVNSSLKSCRRQLNNERNLTRVTVSSFLRWKQNAETLFETPAIFASQFGLRAVRRPNNRAGILSSGPGIVSKAVQW